MSYLLCASVREAEFPAGIMIHSTRLNNLDKLGGLAFRAKGKLKTEITVRNHTAASAYGTFCGGG
jgi:hypothetical protein